MVHGAGRKNVGSCMLIGVIARYLIDGNNTEQQGKITGFLTRNPVKCRVWILPLDESAHWGRHETPDRALFSYRPHDSMPLFLVLSFVNEKHT
jgi:hypothetical protein